MTVINKKVPIILGFGDIFLLISSLILTIALRYRIYPTVESINGYVLPFSIIFIFSIIVFYIFGIYNTTLSVSKSSLFTIILKAQIANGFISISLFYFISSFLVSPKTTLFIYFILSTVLIIIWRLGTSSLISLRKKVPALVIGSGLEIEELIKAMSSNPHSPLYCKKLILSDSSPNEISKLVSNDNDFRYIIADLNDSRTDLFLPELYKVFFPKVSIINSHDLYEDLFDKIPLSSMNYAWIMSHITSITPKFYDLGKRIIEIILSLIIGLIALILYPFIALAIKIEDKGPIFIIQERVGKNNKPIFIYKYRSMTRSDTGKWLNENENKVTKVGRFIRKSRIDELPQALAILKGDMSLIGPRADIIDLGKRLENEIPYYSVRTVITPGLSGWAQINQEKPPQSVEETKIRLSYDLYYIKHRSLSLDLRIALRTLKTLLSRVGM